MLSEAVPAQPKALQGLGEVATVGVVVSEGCKTLCVATQI